MGPEGLRLVFLSFSFCLFVYSTFCLFNFSTFCLFDFLYFHLFVFLTFCLFHLNAVCRNLSPTICTQRFRPVLWMFDFDNCGGSPNSTDLYFLYLFVCQQFSWATHKYLPNLDTITVYPSSASLDRRSHFRDTLKMLFWVSCHKVAHISNTSVLMLVLFSKEPKDQMRELTKIMIPRGS